MKAGIVPRILSGMVALTLPIWWAAPCTCAQQPTQSAAQQTTHSTKAGRPLTKDEVIYMLGAEVAPARVATLARERGIDFQVTPEVETALRKFGADDNLLTALREVAPKPPRPLEPQPGLDAPLSKWVSTPNGGGYSGDYSSDAETNIKRLRKALKNKRADPYLHNALGVALGREGDDEQAIAEFREVIRLQPGLPAAHNNLGVSLASKGDWDSAIAEYREAIRLNPAYGSAHLNLAFALSKKGDHEAAISEWREGIPLVRSVGPGHMYLGIDLARRGDWDAALGEFRESLRGNSSDVTARNNLGVALAYKGDLEGAIGEFRGAAASRVGDAWPRLNLAWMLEHVKGDRRAAFDEYRQVFERYPKNDTARQNYERLARELGVNAP